MYNRLSIFLLVLPNRQGLLGNGDIQRRALEKLNSIVMPEVYLQLECGKTRPSPPWESIPSTFAKEADNLDKRNFDSLGHSKIEVWERQKTEAGSYFLYNAVPCLAAQILPTLHLVPSLEIRLFGCL